MWSESVKIVWTFIWFTKPFWVCTWKLNLEGTTHQPVSHFQTALPVLSRWIFLSVHIFDLETKNYYLYSLLSTACTQQVDQWKKFLLSLHIWHRALSFGTTPAPPWPTSAQVNKWRLTQIQPALTARVIKYDFPKCIYLNVWMSRGKCSAGGDLADCVWWENISKRRVLRTTCPGWGRWSNQYRNHLSNS